jgi:hypothetical protein
LACCTKKIWQPRSVSRVQFSGLFFRRKWDAKVHLKVVLFSGTNIPNYNSLQMLASRWVRILDLTTTLNVEQV